MNEEIYMFQSSAWSEWISEITHPLLEYTRKQTGERCWLLARKQTVTKFSKKIYFFVHGQYCV